MAGAENEYIGALSGVPEHRRKDDHDDRRPHGIDRQVIRLPPFEARERSAPSQKAEVEHGGPRQIDQKNQVLAEGGHAVRAEAELGDTRGDGPQRYSVGQQRTDHQHDLYHIEGAGRRLWVPGGDGIEQKAKDHHQEQIEGDERVPLDVHPAPGPQQGPQKRDQHGGEKGCEEARQHGRHVLDHALLGLHEPGGDHDGPDRSARQQPRLEEGLDVDPDGLEDHRHERREDAAAEGDQHVVDEQLAREPNEVHAAAHLAPSAARVRDAHHQPERDRQVQRREHLGVAAQVPSERVDVGDYARRDEREDQPAESAGADPPLPDEIAGQEGQHEETNVAGVEAGVLIQLDPEERRRLDGQGRHHRKTEDDDGIRSGPHPWLSGIGGDDDELLPEAVRVLARELPREGVEVAHALHRHQERLVGGEPRVGQDSHLLAQVVLQLRHVGGVDRLPAAEVAPPPVDLLLERYRWIWGGHLSTSLWKWRGRRVAGRDGKVERLPDAPQRGVHRLPLPVFLGELSQAPWRDAVVLATAAALRDFPPGLDVAEPLEPMQNGVEHPVRPLHASSGQLRNPLEDGVTVAVLFGKDRQDDRRRGSGYQVLVYLHDLTHRAPLTNPDSSVHGGTIHITTRYVNTRAGRFLSALRQPCVARFMSRLDGICFLLGIQNGGAPSEFLDLDGLAPARVLGRLLCAVAGSGFEPSSGTLETSETTELPRPPYARSPSNLPPTGSGGQVAGRCPTSSTR